MSWPGSYHPLATILSQESPPTGQPHANQLNQNNEDVLAQIDRWWAPDSINKIFYVFTVLPFGLSSAPYVFTKVLKPLNKYWRIQGLCIAIFLDDGWAFVRDRESCRFKALDVRVDFCNAGFVVNEDKSVWEPTQALDWLGISWNSVLGSLEIVERRIVKIINTIDRIINADFQVSARELASFTGRITSTGSVVGNIGRIMTRHCV